MGIYNIFIDGKPANRIVADEEFCRKYCEENGGTFELEESLEEEQPEEAQPEEPESPTELERLRADLDFLAAMTGIDLA